MLTVTCLIHDFVISIYKAEVDVDSPGIQVGSSIIPRYWNSFIQSHPPGENAAHFLVLKPFTLVQFSLQLAHIAAGRPEEMWIQSLPRAFYTWPTLPESNHRPLDLGSNTLTPRSATCSSRLNYGHHSNWVKSVIKWSLKHFFDLKWINAGYRDVSYEI